MLRLTQHRSAMIENYVDPLVFEACIGEGGRYKVRSRKLILSYVVTT